MPRQKNRGQQYFFPTYQAPTRTRRWKMASYIRLSKEDLQKIKKGLDCSNSVKNQRDILNYFYETHAEEFESIQEYVDDGHTGTDTDREHGSGACICTGAGPPRPHLRRKTAG